MLLGNVTYFFSPCDLRFFGLLIAFVSMVANIATIPEAKIKMLTSTSI